MQYLMEYLCHPGLTEQSESYFFHIEWETDVD